MDASAQAVSDFAQRWLPKSNLQTLDEIFAEAMKANHDKIIKALERFRVFDRKREEYLQFKHLTVPYFVTMKQSLKYERKTPTFAITGLPNNGCSYLALPFYKKDLRRHRLTGWIQLPVGFLQAIPTIVKFHEAVSGHKPAMFYHVDAQRFDVISYSDDPARRVEVTFECGAPDRKPDNDYGYWQDQFAAN